MDTMTETAPKRIWLQVNPEGDPDDHTEPFPDPAGDEITWAGVRVGGQEVEYVRADLVRAAMPTNADDPEDPEVFALAEVLGLTANA